MRILTFLACTMSFAGCSNPIEGLWIEKEERVLLKFYKDSVINSSLQVSWFRDTLGYYRVVDSITFTGLNPEISGITERTFRYALKDDSLIIWHRPDASLTYFKSDADDYLEYFLSKGGLHLELPRAECVRPTTSSYVLNIKLGYVDDRLTLVVDGEECSFTDFDAKVKQFKSQNFLDDIWGAEITCQLFIDETVECGHTFQLIDCLKINDLRRVNFIALSKEYNRNTSDFYGLQIYFPSAPVNIIEQANTRK